VQRRFPVGARSTAFDLEAADGAPLPTWTPGAHIELLLPLPGGQAVRPYSLCGAAFDGATWRIAVLREAQSRGGSAYLCDELEVGDTLLARGPNNHFVFTPAPRVHFLAGGIGITPLLGMARGCAAQGSDWRMTYMSRNEAEVNMASDLARLPQERVELYFSGLRGRLDLREWIRELNEGDVVYACGPMRLLDDLEHMRAEALAQRAARGHWQLHLERFANPNRRAGESDAFEVVLARSKKTLRVARDETLLGVLKRAGIDVPSSCCEGVCGTCEQAVLAGIPDHRDAVLSELERQQGNYMMVCVSRALSASITLDL
jgi:ferredoxin-NADP reductase